MPPKILLTRALSRTIEERLARNYDLTVDRRGLGFKADELREALKNYDGICSNWNDQFNASAFPESGLRARIIANYGVGIEHVDLAAASRAGVLVANTPHAVTEPTADMAMMLILMATRRAGEGERIVRRGGWRGMQPDQMLGQSLSGKLLGLVGLGRIGQATAQRARAFGMRIAYYNRSGVAHEIEQSLDARRYASLDELIEDADVVSLHCPGGAETRHLINRARIARMKPTAVIVNTARGPVIDEAAMTEALVGKKIAAAGLDVYEREPDVTPALLTLENVVLIPHLGSATAEARLQMGYQMADNLDAFFAGKAPPDRVV
jgi:lactate dehydrogenase-like 2-hydroxyacid dehydrogenase